MSDNFRQSFTDKAESTTKPESQKSTTERVGDFAKGKADSAASSAQPESEKSFTQRVGDTFSGISDEDAESLVGKAKNLTGYGESNK